MIKNETVLTAPDVSEITPMEIRIGGNINIWSKEIRANKKSGHEYTTGNLDLIPATQKRVFRRMNCTILKMKGIRRNW